jgi:SAM-dependent methyltransferase
MAIEEIYRYPDDYDLELAAREVDDIPFWQGLLRRETPHTVLEVGCGTGRITLPLARQGARQGFQVIGLEAEQPMLDRASQRCAAEPAEVQRALQLVHGDLRTIDLRTRFEAILLPYGIAHHLICLDDQIAAWRNARRHLHPGGLLAVDVGAAEVQVLAEEYEGTERHVDLEAQGDDGRHLRRTVASRYAPAEQLATHAYVYDAENADGSHHRYRSDFKMHVYYPREMELLCRLTGFEVERLIGSYRGEPFDDRSALMIALARAR